MLNLFKERKINIPDDIYELNATHQKCLSDAILEGRIDIKSNIIDLRSAWLHIRSTFKNNILQPLPNKPNAEIQINDGEVFIEEEDEDEITLEILFQLDYYSQIELDRIINNAREFMKWKDELAQYGKLFTKANLLKTIFNNTSWDALRDLYILLYEEDPICWIPKKDKKTEMNGKISRLKTYTSNTNKIRHKKMIAIAETGIDLSIKNEKMFAWWHLTLFPEWPFIRTVKEPYNTIFTHIHSWRKANAKRSGTTIQIFNNRILPDIHTIYPMYLRLLIDSSANTDTVSSTEIYPIVGDKYGMGVEHYHLRMLDSRKIRSNTIPPSYISKGTFTDQCINFFTEWLASIYKRSDYNTFLQYVGHGGKIHQLSAFQVTTLNPLSFRAKKAKRSYNYRFFEKYEIYKSVQRRENNKISWEKERVWWVKHKNIRAANNFKNYNVLYGEWVRSRVILGHQSSKIEKDNYQKYSWLVEEQHQIASSLLQIQKFIEKKIVDKKLENIFEQPHCSCKDNKHPTFDGGPKINDGEICTMWRNCITKCENSYIFPSVHGPTYIAWKIIMEEARNEFIHTEDWEKEYKVDYNATLVVINKFKEDEKEIAQSKAAERIPFVRLMMMQTKQKRKVNIVKQAAINE